MPVLQCRRRDHSLLSLRSNISSIINDSAPLTGLIPRLSLCKPSDRAGQVKRSGHRKALCSATPSSLPATQGQRSANGQTKAEPGTSKWYYVVMKRKRQRTLELIFSRPVSGSLPWRDIEALFQELGGEVSERAGSRVAVVLFGEVRVFHRPHPSPDTNKGAVASIRKWFEEHGVTP